MAKFSLRRYDTQALVSVILALISVVCLIGLALCVFRNMNWSEFVIYHGPRRKPIVMVAGAITMLLSVCGFGLGYNSAGQRRNDKQQLSWLGFFVSALVMCLTLIILFLFRARAESVIS